MRKLLDGLYYGSGLLAGLFVVAIAVLILAQVVGRWFNVLVPSTEDFSGYFLAASSFLGLAYTLRVGGHIRVNILIHNFGPKLRAVQEVGVLIVGLALATFMSYWLIHMVWESWHFNEKSLGYVRVSLWIPQVPVAIGAVIFNIAVLDELIHTLRHGKPTYHGLDDELEEVNELMSEDASTVEQK